MRRVGGGKVDGHLCKNLENNFICPFFSDKQLISKIGCELVKKIN